jgi:amino acid adenylation domain-containing protein
VSTADLPLSELLTAERLASLAPEQRELLSQWLSTGQQASYPASPRQRGMWFLGRQTDGSPMYNVPFSYRVRGDVDPALLHRALDAVADRHEVLRTRFASEDGMPVQLVTAGLRPDWRETDLTGLAASSSRQDEAARVARRFAARPFDLGSGEPLIRAELVRMAPGEHILMVNVHHIVFDGWSMGILTRELWEHYIAYREGREPPLPRPAVQYGTIARRQLEELSGGELDGQIAYWTALLEGAPPMIEVTGDRPRPATPDNRGGVVDIPLDPALLRELNKLARAHRVTLFMLMFAVFNVLMSRYAGQDDLVIGVPAAGRTGPEAQDVIGLFMNVLPMRTRVPGDMTFRDLLRQIRGDALAAFGHQDVPTDVIASRMRFDRDRTRNPLFQHMFSLYDRSHPIQVPGLELEPVDDIWNGCAKLDLSWAVWLDGDHSKISVEYMTACYEAATVKRMAGHLLALCRSVIADPGARIRDLDLLAPAEVAAALAQGAEVPAGHATMQEMFEAQVRRTPAAVALAAGDTRLTYAELNAAANRLAHRLRRLGAGPDRPVAVCAERSAEQVVAMLATWKSGGAYLPLDPSLPAGRLSFMLADSGAPILLRGAGAPLDGGPARTLALDDPAWNDEPDSDPAPVAGPANASYLIYTSGSTGRPKSVVNTHGGIVNHMEWIQRTYPLRGGDVVLGKTAIGFDVSVWEYAWPLLTGARLVLARPGGHRDPGYLRDLIIDQNVTVAHFVPSMLAAFLDAPGIEACASMRRTVCSGEELPGYVAARHAERLGGELLNLYGPAEAAVHASHWPCGGETGRVPIGTPVDNIRLYVLDSWLRPQPAGVPGQLAIAGAGLARGYHGQAALTADRFVPDPFGPPGSRMYLTGDLVRRRAEGPLEFLGRMDHQVKIRGQRIELGEIESALREQPGVRAAAAVVREDRPGDKRIVGYVVADDGTAPGELRDALRRALPGYMVPAALVPLPALPVSPNGKLDRRALPAPDEQPAGGGVPPRSPLERRLAAIWRDVLGRPGIGVRDDFFDIGGHSLDVLRLTAQVETHIGAQLSPADLFDYPTIEALARMITGGGRQSSQLTELAAGGGGRPLVLVHATGGTVTCYAPLARALDTDVYGISARGVDSAEPPLSSVPEMASRYLELLAEAGLAGADLAGWSFGGLVAFEMARIRQERGQDGGGLVLLDAPPPRRVPPPPFDDADLLDLYAYELGRTVGCDLGIDAERLRALPPQDRPGLLLERAREHGVLDSGVSAQHMLRAGSVMAANVSAMAGYRPDGTYQGPVTLVAAAERDMSARSAWAHGDEGRWADVITGPLTVRRVPGGHYSFLRPPHVTETADALTTALRSPDEEFQR